MAMPDAAWDSYQEMQALIAWSDADSTNLQALGPVFADAGAGITDLFYDRLLENPRTAKILEGRVDALKATHQRWMGTLFAGDYGRDFAAAQYRIGDVHVTVGILPEFVEGVSSVLRQEGLKAIDAADAGSDAAASYVRVLDLCLMMINLAYANERTARVSKFTGMSAKLIENIIKSASKKKK